MRRSWGVARLLAGIVLAAAVAAGCGGGGGGAPAPVEEGTPTPTPVPPSVPTAAPRPTETVVPTIGPTSTPEPRASGLGQTFTSPLYNYDIGVPQGWTVGPGAGKIGSFTADVFTGPNVDGFTTNVNIIAQPLPTGIADTSSYFRANLATLQNTVGANVTIVGSTPVGGGGRATLISYELPRPNGNGQTYRVYQAVFVANNRGWVITLSTPIAGADQALLDFKAMLQSFAPK